MGKHPLTMHQFRNFFNTCRIPHKDCDELVNCFRTGLFYLKLKLFLYIFILLFK